MINTASPIKQQLKVYFYFILKFPYNWGEDQKATLSSEESILGLQHTLCYKKINYNNILTYLREFSGTEENLSYIHISNIANGH